MREEKDAALPNMVRKMIQAARSGSEADPLGSYTGTPAGEPREKPTQDADDL
ncbi:MAG TPA: hypothetical protein H9795_03045 [Candidatus Fournierella merdigallinarum]|nr:hypothetical protein [Candidatus Fournierella merdigallinarum]